MDFKTDILRFVGKYSWDDNVVFKRYLRMPKPYMKGMFQLYPTDLHKAGLEITSLLDRCDSAHWRRIKVDMTHEEQKLYVRYKIARIPPMYIRNDKAPECAERVLKITNQIIESPAEFSEMGRLLYFHSTFEDNALLAASGVVKSGVRAGLKCQMLPFVKYMEAVRAFDNSPVIKSMQEADISVLSMVGAEYINKESGFTESTLEEFVKLRRMAGKSTILTSHLDAAEFADRYKMGLDRLGATVFKFEDGAIGLTLINLGKELEEIRKSKEVR